MTEPSLPAAPRNNLSVTALYTAGVWHWAGVPGADLWAGQDVRRVFGVVNAVLGFARLFAWGAPSLKHELAHRHAALDRVVERAAPPAVLELAAGLSSRGLTFTSASAVQWVEVDLPGMVAYKEGILASTPAGRAIASRGNLCRVAADVTTADLEAILPAQPGQVVLAEGLLMYLSIDDRAALFRKLVAYLRPHGGLLAFDLVPPAELPQVGWVGRVLKRLLRAATGGQGFEETPEGRADVERALREAGFDHVQVVVTGDVVKDWKLPFPGWKTSQLIWQARVDGADP